MQLTITGKNIEINDTLRSYVEKKIGRLDRYLPNVIDGRVELEKAEGARAAEDRQVAQVTLRTKNAVLRAEEASNDIFASIDAVVEKMQRQADRYKDKRRAKRSRTRSRSRLRVGPARGRRGRLESSTTKRPAVFACQAVPDDPDGRGRSHRADGVAGARLLRVLQREPEPDQRALPPPQRRVRADPARTALMRPTGRESTSRPRGDGRSPGAFIGAPFLKTILFVCTANICRSPMAAALLRDRIAKAGLGIDRSQVLSAGVWAETASRASTNATAVRCASAASTWPHTARSRSTRPCLSKADIVLVMEEAHRRSIFYLAPEALGEGLPADRDGRRAQRRGRPIRRDDGGVRGDGGRT